MKQFFNQTIKMSIFVPIMVLLLGLLGMFAYAYRMNSVKLTTTINNAQYSGAVISQHGSNMVKYAVPIDGTKLDKGKKYYIKARLTVSNSKGQPKHVNVTTGFKYSGQSWVWATESDDQSE